MKTSTILIALLACPCVAAAAQAPRTWVLSTGDDNNPCSRTAPCKTFAGAYAKTFPGGEISVIDAGGYGILTITHSISITNDGSGEASIVPAGGTSAFTIDAGPADIVRIDGVVMDGGTTPNSPANYGIRFNSGGALHVHRCIIRNFVTGGISFTPSGISKLFVTDTILSNNGVATNGGAIMIAPTGAGAAKSAINRVSLENNVSGITATATAGIGTILTTVTETMAAGSRHAGFSLISPATATASPNTMMIDRSTASGNETGVSASGLASVAVLNNSVVVANHSGLMVTNGGQILSYKNNALHHNDFQGGVTGPLTAQ